MISVYLNSLYNFLYVNNPFLGLLKQIIINTKAFYHWPQNMDTLQRKLSAMKQRESFIQTNVEQHYDITGQKNQFDINR